MRLRLNRVGGISGIELAEKNLVTDDQEIISIVERLFVAGPYDDRCKPKDGYEYQITVFMEDVVGWRFLTLYDGSLTDDAQKLIDAFLS